MAANKIRGITIEIGGDTTGLDKALRGVNSEIKTTQNELKDVEKALKLDPANVELLAQKQRLLADAVDATAKKLDTLKTAQEQAQAQLERGEISQQQYDALTREIVKAEDALKAAKTAAADFAAQHSNIAKLSGSMKEVSNAAGKVASATAGASAAAGGLIAGLAGAGLKAAKSADELSTLAKRTGLSTEELQKMQYASELVDVSVSDMTGALAKLKKNMASSSAQSVFEQLGVATTTASGEMRDANTVFYEALTALSQVANETERDQLAMEIFGKSADNLAGIIDDGGAALKAYGDEAAQLGLIMDEQTLTGLNKVNDQMDRLKAQAGAELAQTGAKALEALTPVIEKVVAALSDLLTWVGDLDADTIQMILTIAAVVAAISPVAGLISGITGAVSGILALVPALQAAFGAVTAFAAANPVGIILIAVTALAALIVAKWDEIKPILEKLKALALEVFGKIAEKVGEMKEKVKAGLEAMKNAITGVMDSIKGAVKGRINTIIGYVNAGIGAINKIINALNDSVVGDALGVIGAKIPTIPTVPLLAKGGVLSNGSAIVGEAGAELLTMAGNKAVVQPLTNNYNTTNNYQNATSPVQVTLTLDGQVLARQLVSPMRAATVMAGSSNMR